MRTTINTLFALAAVALVTSCNSKKKPNYQYFPNMYESVAYEAYSSHEVFAKNNTSEALKPVEGTVHRGWLPYDYDNTPKGYQEAKANSSNPIAYTKENAAAGMQLYTIYCAICHGDKGNGKGTLVKREKILGVPSYDDQGRNINAGSIYHVMYYGINSMGSYAAQTTIKERWQIAQYVESLKANLEGKKPRVDSSSTEISIVEALSAADKTHTSHSEATIGLAEKIEVNVENDASRIEEAKSEVKEKVSYSKKGILGGKSHHSHKKAGKK